MKLTLIGDTHMRHEELGVMKGDVLIHCGDMFDLFQQHPDDLAQVDAWFAKQRFDLILCIGGNHDFPLTGRQQGGPQPFRNAVYLQDQSHEFGGVTFYGAPWVPHLNDHAFYADDHMLAEKWAGIPQDTDVLITHTPPQNVLDQSSRGHVLGCHALADRVTQLRPNIHCFGHVHASGGKHKSNGTRFVNASSVHKQDGRLRRPIKLRV